MDRQSESILLEPAKQLEFTLASLATGASTSTNSPPEAPRAFVQRPEELLSRAGTESRFPEEEEEEEEDNIPDDIF